MSFAARWWLQLQALQSRPGTDRGVLPENPARFRQDQAESRLEHEGSSCQRWREGPDCATQQYSPSPRSEPCLRQRRDLAEGLHVGT